MFGRASLMVGLSLAAVVASNAWAQQDIRPQPGGKRLLFVDGDTIRPEPGGKRLLFIDGNDIRPEPGGKRLLFVDGDDVRPEPGGIRLAFIDGDDIRRAPGGKILMNYHHPDICPTFKENRIFFVDGAQLTKPQLVAVLYQLKPELFKVSAEEQDAQAKAMKEAGEAEDKRLAADRPPGKWDVLSAGGTDDVKRDGKVLVSKKKGDTYLVKFEPTSGTAAAGEGVGVQQVYSADHHFWVAWGPPKTVGLCVYQIKGGTLEGKWYPWYSDGDAKNVGSENLKGPESLDGDFTITSAKSPATGAEYTGKVTIKPVEIVGSADSMKPYNVTWTIGDKTFKGVGFRAKDWLVVSCGSGDSFYIGDFIMGTNGDMIGDWYNHKNQKGWYNNNKQGE